MFTKEIESLSRQELQTLLDELVLYRDLRKKLGNRGRKIFTHKKDGVSEYSVEYYPALEKSFVVEKALQVYKDIFSLELSETDIVFSENSELGGGIRVFADDQVLDLSYKKIENKFA